MNKSDEHTQAHQRALKALAGMTPEERVQLLKEAGIFDKDGDLSERYRPPEYIAIQQQRLADTLHELFLHFDSFHYPGRWYVTLGLGPKALRVGEGATPQEAADKALSDPRVIAAQQA